MEGEVSRGRSQRTERPPPWLRVTDVTLGLASVVLSVVVLANLDYRLAQLVLLLGVSLLLSAVRMAAIGGVRRRLASIESIGFVGGGLLTGGVVLVALFFPGLSFETLVYLFAITLTIQGLGRISRFFKRGPPSWLRGSALVVGAVTVLLAAVAVMAPSIAALTLVPVLAVIVLVNGIEMVVWGLSPTDPRQILLLKLILFSAFYGLILVNWIDLFATSAPAYHIWLILTYMAPFGVLIVFQGFKDWQLALSLGLLVSLMNDVGYFFVGDLMFGFHQALLPWIEGQLGFHGYQVLFTFEGGAFSLPITSVLMGISIYARIVVVSLILYDWWRRPVRLKVRSDTSD